MPRPLFTAENAAEMARRSQAAQKERKAKLAALTLPAKQSSELPAQSDIERAQELAIVNQQITMTDQMILKCRDAKELQALSNSIRVFFERKCVLAGIHKPAPLKAVQPKDKRTKLNDLPQPE